MKYKQNQGDRDIPRASRVVVLACVVALLAGCPSDDSDDDAGPGPGPGPSPTTRLPSTSLLKLQVLNIEGNSLDFSTEFFAVDADSDLIPLSATQVEIQDFVGPSTGATYDFTRTAFDLQSQSALGPYSALFMMDQSGSITGTDPNDARITAAKVFMSNLGSGDEVGLAAFADGGSIPHSPVTAYSSHGQRYTASVDGFIGALDQLANLEGGNTPLYDAAIIGTDDVVNLGNNSNKAMMLFSDGADTSSQNGLDSAIGNADLQGVKIYTIGLSDAVDKAVLARLALETGGAYSQASDARQLISLYGALGDYLAGHGQYYRAVWNVVRSSPFSSGSFTTSIVINTGNGFLTVPIHVVIP